MGGVVTGEMGAVRSGKMGARGILRDTVVGVASVGVFEEDRDAEGNERLRLTVLRLLKRAKIRARATMAFVRGDVGTLSWVARGACGTVAFAVRLARQCASI